MHAAPWINIHAEDSQLYLLVVTASAVLFVPPNIFSSVYIICVNITRPSPCKQTGLLNKQLSILDVATPGSNFYKSKIKILPLTDHFLKQIRGCKTINISHAHMFMSLSSALTKSFAWLKLHHCLVQESQHLL